jgi:hypothetical protein
LGQFSGEILLAFSTFPFATALITLGYSLIKCPFPVHSKHAYLSKSQCTFDYCLSFSLLLSLILFWVLLCCLFVKILFSTIVSPFLFVFIVLQVVSTLSCSAKRLKKNICFLMNQNY